MKLLKGNFRIFILIILFIVAGFVLYSLIPGTVFRSQPDTSTTPGNENSVVALKADASFDIQEADVRIVTHITSTRVTY